MEERHSALFLFRAAIYALAAVVATLPATGLGDTDRMRAVLLCAAALLAQAGLRLVSDRWPRLLRVSVDVALVVDGLALVGLATLDQHLESRALWLIPILAIAVALGLSTLSGMKALALFAVATGAIWLLGPSEATLLSAEALAPLLVAAAAVVVAAVMGSVNERELRRRGERVDVLYDAGMAFVALRDPEELSEAARTAAQRLLPGWAVAIGLGAHSEERRTWREDGLVQLALPIMTPSPAGSESEPAHHGVLRASLREPRGRRTVTIRGQQLRALEALCTGLAAALTKAELLTRLEHLSRVDPLTGLANRRAFDDALEVELARSRRSGDPVALAILDVDHFKRFNDSFGHLAGDRALAAVAARLTAAARREDWSCRIGGEEFAVLLPGADHSAAAEVAERLRLAVERITLPEGPITVSVGVAAARGVSDAQTLVAEADRLLYEAKRQGRNRVVAASTTTTA